MIRHAVVLALAFVFWSPVQAGKLVKWVDKDGKVHYSDQEPTEQARSVTHLRKPKHMNVPVAAEDKPVHADGDRREQRPKTAADEAAAFKERQVKKAEAEVEEKKKKDELAMKEKNCTMARNHSQQLDQGGRFTYAGPNGETLFMDEKQIEQAKVEARGQIEAWCKG